MRKSSTEELSGFTHAKTSRIGPFTFEEYLEEVRRFHSYAAPGVVLGGFLVEKAKKHMPSGILYNALSETASCLPDAIQLLTPCTIGNGWLKVVDLGRFALALYSKESGEGIRVTLDHERLAQFAELRDWFYKVKPKGGCREEVLIQEIKEAGALILQAHSVRVKVEQLRRRKKERIVRCPSCGEAYPAEFGPSCPGCRGESPYLP